MVGPRDRALRGRCLGRRPGPRHRALARYRRRGARARGGRDRARVRADLGAWPVRHSSTTSASREPPGPAGDVAVRIVASEPAGGACCGWTSWSPPPPARRSGSRDAYFAGFPPTCRRSGRRRQDGVDVRLLVPGATDIPILRPALAGRLPAAARGGRAGLRVERPHAARQDRGRRRTVGPGGLEQPQRRELGRELRARRRDRGRALRAAHDAAVRDRSRQCHRGAPAPDAHRAAGSAACAWGRERGARGRGGAPHRKHRQRRGRRPSRARAGRCPDPGPGRAGAPAGGRRSPPSGRECWPGRSRCCSSGWVARCSPAPCACGGNARGDRPRPPATRSAPGSAVIEVQVAELRQLFNAIDPSLVPSRRSRRSRRAQPPRRAQPAHDSASVVVCSTRSTAGSGCSPRYSTHSFLSGR